MMYLSSSNYDAFQSKLVRSKIKSIRSRYTVFVDMIELIIKYLTRCNPLNWYMKN